MLQNLLRATLALTAGLGLAATAAAQEMPMPKPGPEHKVLAMDEGTWDAKVEMFMAPGQPPMVSQGTEVNTMGCGGLCLITDFKADMGGTPFDGHGTATWDPSKKKYVGTWVDSMSSGIMTSEGTYDAATKTSTAWSEGPGPTGEVVKQKGVVVYKDPSTRLFTMSIVGPDGKEVETLKITYKKRN
jgi:hypothetical protein